MSDGGADVHRRYGQNCRRGEQCDHGVGGSRGRSFPGEHRYPEQGNNEKVSTQTYHRGCPSGRTAPNKPILSFGANAAVCATATQCCDRASGKASLQKYGGVFSRTTFSPASSSTGRVLKKIASGDYLDRLDDASGNFMLPHKYRPILAESWAEQSRSRPTHVSGVNACSTGSYSGKPFLMTRS